MGTLGRAGWGDPESTGSAAPSACLDRTAKNHNVLVSRVGMHRNYGAEREARSVYRPILDRLRQRQQRDAPQEIDRDPSSSITVHEGLRSWHCFSKCYATHDGDPESSKSGNGNQQHLREMTLRSA
jgi:hypothetical protein